MVEQILEHVTSALSSATHSHCSLQWAWIGLLQDVGRRLNSNLSKQITIV